MTSKSQVTLTFAGDADKLNRTIGKVESRLGKMNRKLTGASQKFAGGVGKVVKGATVIGGAGVLALGAFSLKAIEAGEALNSIRSQTEAVVKSTEGIANVSAKHVKEYGQELSDLAAVDRKVIEASENVLLTFTNVRNEMGRGNDIFDQGALAALNMSAALGTDLQQATIQVGKALNDPIAGVSALGEAGIQFTQQQKDQIKTMTEAGDILGAQKMILGELETQFAGSAAANADASDKIKLAFSRITEEIGLKLLPYLDIFADWVLNTGIPALESFAGWIGDVVVPKLQDLGGWLGDNVVPILVVLGDWLTETGIPALETFAGWLSENTDVLKAVAIGVTAMLVPAFVAWAISAGVAAAATLLAMAPIILIGIAVAALAYLIIRNWDTIKGAFSAGWDFVKGVTSAAWDAIKSTVSGVLSGIKTLFNTYVSIYKGIFKKIVSAATTVFAGITSAIAAPFRGAFKGVKTAWNNTVGGKGFSVPDWVPKIGGKSFKIPYLAKGGILMPRPGGVPFVGAEAGKAEAVIPLDRLDAMMRSGGGGQTTLVIRGDGSRFSEAVLELLQKAIHRHGGDPVVVLGS